MIKPHPGERKEVQTESDFALNTERGVFCPLRPEVK